MAARAVRRLASVPSGATAEEVAAIVAALAVIDAEDRARVAAGTAGVDDDRIDAWVRDDWPTLLKKGAPRKRTSF